MIISYKNKYIFVANPKTATTSIQSFLLSVDESAKKNWIEIRGEKYKFREHYTALQIKEVLGELYEEFTVFGFVRNPLDKIVSSYHFLKNGKPITQGHKRSTVPLRLKILTSRILPFKIWALVYPYKSNKEYFTGLDERMIVDKIGLFENLNKEFGDIIIQINGNLDISKLPEKNRSSHNQYDNYIKGSLFKYLLNKKIKFDIDFYKNITSDGDRI